MLKFINLCAILSLSYPTWEVTAWWCPDTTVSLWSVPDHFRMDGARNTVVQFSIQFRQLVCYNKNIIISGSSNILDFWTLILWNIHVYTLASVISRTAAASTILRITNFLIALSLGTQRAQLVQRTGLTWPRPCFDLPPLRRLRVCSWKFNNI